MTTETIIEILNKYSYLISGYYLKLHMKTLGYVENADYFTKLGCLADSIASKISDNTLPPQDMIDILDLVENMVILQDKDGESGFEIMFFEDLIYTLSEIKQSEPNYRYVGLFRDNLGPSSQRLCNRNNEFWHKLLKTRTF